MTTGAALSIDTLGQSRGHIRQDRPRDLPNMSCRSGPHSSSLPSSPPIYSERDDMASPTVARKPAFDRENIRNGLHLALVKEIPQYRCPAKEVADLVDTSEGTVRSLRQANIPEAMVTLVMLARAYPRFGGEVRRLMGAGDLDPEFQRDLADLLRRVL
jgi:hypothetical protein